MTVPNTTIDQPIADTFLIQRFGLWIYGESSIIVNTTTNPHLDVTWMDMNPNVPNIGASFSNSDSGDKLENLRLEERETRVINMSGPGEGTKTYRVKIRLIYRLSRFAGTPSSPASTGLHKSAVRGGGSLSQIKTFLDGTEKVITVDFDTEDENGDPVTLTSVPQGVDVLQPQATTVREIVLQTNQPDDVVLGWLGFTNNGSWNGAGSDMWLCTDARYELINSESNPIWFAFSFEFMLAPNEEGTGWKYLVPYRDVSLRIPEGVTINNGIKKMDYHPQRNFGTFF